LVDLALIDRPGGAVDDGARGVDQSMHVTRRPVRRFRQGTMVVGFDRGTDAHRARGDQSIDSGDRVFQR
jgi:hypothetical protein